MKIHATSLRNATLPTSSPNLHAHLNACGVPSGNSAFSRSLHDFTRILLGIEVAKSDLPPSPPSSQLTTFQTRAHKAYTDTSTLTCFCVYLSKHNLAELEVSRQSKSIPVICCQFFVEDLALANIHCVSFAWLQPAGSPYNEWFATMIWKHWTFAKNNGLLHKYAISPADDTTPNGQMVLFRWVHGRQHNLRKSLRTPNWRELQSAREKRSKRTKQVCYHSRIRNTLAII